MNEANVTLEKDLAFSGRSHSLTRSLAAILDSSYDGVWICGGDGTILFVNKAAERLNPLIVASEVVGMNVEEAYSRGFVSKPVTTEVIKSGKQVSKIHEVANGSRLLITGSPVLDEKGRVELVVVNLRDVSVLEKLRKELEEIKAVNRSLVAGIADLSTRITNSYGDLIRSASMRRVYETATRAAEFDTTLLITGESGVGKGVLAKHIHKSSPRRDGPFISVSCAALPHQLIESELFGYQRGAFTGAHSTGKPGLVEVAEGGTLFLDELGEVPITTQVKLLRFLEDKEILPVGSTISKEVNTRVIAATNRDLEEMVANGHFREDLFFRVNVISIKVPPLRERVEDIPILINYFVEEFGKSYSKTKRILPRTIDRLCRYSFPGNVRELSNIIERLLILTPSEQIDVEDLPEKVLEEVSAFPRSRSAEEMSLRRARDDLERKAIVKALAMYGSQRKAAKFLGIDQSTLCRKVRRYNISSNFKIH